MSLQVRIAKAVAASTIAIAAVSAGSAQAAPFTVNVGSDFSTMPTSINYEGSTFTFSSTGDLFNPAAITTAGGGAVRAFGGFFGIPVVPSTDFPDRGTGVLTYGPGMQFASFTSQTTIPYSNGDNYLGLRATQGGQNYYGYAFFTNTVLNSFAFETAANTAISINTSTAAVPEPASWAMLILGMGIVGYAMRRRQKVTTRVSFAA